ncbi:ParB/RepB/Spo0J family partition protein [bacterium]|jgi:ParB family chromosome partitioning protein|nr:ParB/RepB/Spo0J family partition protein [bacterium]MBT7311622.1 ParB/RepB/Spo0J family partition protein [bacterium]
MNKRNSVLGKGLSALIADIETDSVGDFGDKEARIISIASIGLNPGQPRKIFKDNKIEELSHSIRQVGVLQPVLVRKLNHGEPKPVSLSERITGKESFDTDQIQYCLVAGERRVRATAMANLTEIPAIICSYQEVESIKVALLENIQRENLNPIEEAFAFQKLLDGYGATQEELSEMLGKSRSGIANTLRLLSLETEIQELIQDEKISRGHAKVLLGISDHSQRLSLAKLCVSKGLSVRDCEKRIQSKSLSRRTKTIKQKQTYQESREIRTLRERAEQRLGSPVLIERNSDGRGVLTIKFYTDEDLLRILEVMEVNTDLS